MFGYGIGYMSEISAKMGKLAAKNLTVGLGWGLGISIFKKPGLAPLL